MNTNLENMPFHSFLTLRIAFESKYKFNKIKQKKSDSDFCLPYKVVNVKVNNGVCFCVHY